MSHVVYEYRDAEGFCCYLGLGGEPNAWEHFEAAVSGLELRPRGLNLYLRERLAEGATYADISPVIVAQGLSLHEAQMEVMRRERAYGALTIWTEKPLYGKTPRYMNGYRVRETPTVLPLPALGPVTLTHKPLIRPQTGVFARVITGYNWNVRAARAEYGASWITLPIFSSTKRDKEHTKRKRLRPDEWPIQFDYTISDAADRIFAALEPPDQISNEMLKRSDLGIKESDQIRACELAGFIQTTTGLDNFILVFESQAERIEDDYGSFLRLEPYGVIFKGIVPIAVPTGDYVLANHVLDKGKDIFSDAPAGEIPFLWDQIAEGAFLTDAERMLLPHNRIVPPPVLDVSYQPFDEEKALANFVRPTPSPVNAYLKEQPADPKLDQALANLKNAMGLP